MYLRQFNQPAAHKIPVRVVKSGPVDNSNSIQPFNQSQPNDTRRDDVKGLERTDGTDWQAMAQRLQADMDNFRKRQTRRADQAVADEKERLLHLLLAVADNLDRALKYDDQSDQSLRQGVELTYRELMRMLETEGVTRLETVGQPFTPDLHEAIAAVPGNADPNTIIEEVAAGYKLGDKLLRPAQVVVTT
jgi:molecular chaperone GrpE